MDNSVCDAGRPEEGVLSRHRRLLWASGILVLAYTLLGFFLIPFLVGKLAVDTVRERYGSELTIDRVAFNPYVLDLQIDGLVMRSPDGEPFVGVRQIYANLQLSSLFRLAPTFAEIRLDTPEAHLARSAAGTLNTDFLAQPAAAEASSEQDTATLQPPRLIVHVFAVNEAALHWNDMVPAQPVKTTLGPVNVAIQNLSTLPQREGQQEVVITTETAGVFRWSGTLQLNPLHSAGHAQVVGSHMPLISAYIREAAGFEVVRGHADIGFDYVLDIATDEGLRARIDNFDFELEDVLVRTFGRLTASGEVDDRDVFAMPALVVGGGALRWPERTVRVEEIAINEAGLSIHRDSEGILNVLPPRQATDSAVAPDELAAGGSDDWSVTLGRFAINGMSIGLIDDSVQPQADIGIDDLTLTVDGISTEAGGKFPTDIAVTTRSGGTVRIAGQIGVLPDAFAELSINAAGLALAETHPYLKPLADVNLDSGQLGLDATVKSGPDDAFEFAGDISIVDLLITETDEGSRLGSWDRLTFEKVVASLGSKKVEVSEVRFEKPYADVFIAEDGSINLGRIEPGEQVQKDAEEQDEAEEPKTDPSTEPAEPPFEVTIGRVVIAAAAADFADYSLPLPFQAGIKDLNGQVTTIATASSEPSEVNMEGKVDDFGLLLVSGTITPFDVASKTDIQLRFQNVGIPKFSPYTIAFAGREIASGKLDLDLGYALTDSELVGENRIVLRDFGLGDKVEHPGAMSLPLGLAVALLKGPDGTIDIDLPVRGNIDDPEFGYGRVIGKALVNLIVKIVASPFALLGNLVGMEADELSQIAFIEGRSDLTPPEQERVAKIAEALALRPELMLEIYGVVDREADGLALRTAKFDGLVESRIETSSDAGATDAMYAAQRAEVIEALYQELADTEKVILDELRTRFTSITEPESGRTTSAFDSLAYTAELRRLLIEALSVTDLELTALATARADSVRVALATTDATLADRIRSGEAKEVDAENDGRIQMHVTLATGEE